MINNQDPHSETENDERLRAEYSDENDSDDTETSKTSVACNFMSKILPNDKIAEIINSFNSKQRGVFNVVHTWAKDHVKYRRHNVKPLYIYIYIYIYISCDLWTDTYSTLREIFMTAPKKAFAGLFFC